MFKNITRFVKNPFGYAYWKIEPLHRANRIRPVWFFMLAQMYFSFTMYTLLKNKKERMIESWYYRIGEITKT